MCLAVIIDENFAFSYRDFCEAIDQHRDGVGISYADQRGNLVTVKTWPGDPAYSAVREQIEDLACLPHYAARILHFRFATKGRISPDNTHPIAIPSWDAAMVHNGTQPGMGNATVSDTAEIADWADQLDDLAFLRDVSHSVAVAHSDGTIDQFGSWHEHDEGVQISNHYTLAWRGTSPRYLRDDGYETDATELDIGGVVAEDMANRDDYRRWLNDVYADIDTDVDFVVKGWDHV